MSYNHSIITKAKLRKLCDAKLQGLLIWQPVTIIYYDNSFFYFLSKGSGNIRALTAKKSALKLKKWISLGAILTSILSLSFAVITIYSNNVGFFLIELEDSYKNIALCESSDFLNSTDTLYVTGLEHMTNISGEGINNEAIHQKDGSNNSESRYIAHTFYLKNVSNVTIDYRCEVNINEATKGIDSAVRVRLIKDGEVITYAKRQETGSIGDPEPNTDPFYSSLQPVNNVVYNMKSGEVHKYSIIIYLEGNDPQCIDDILGGMIRMNMKFNVL